MIIRDLSTADRPREKLAKFGAAYLTDAELIALLFNTSGQRNRSVLDLARDLLGENGSLRELAGKSGSQISTVKGIGPTKAAVIQAVFELAHRFEEEKHPIADFHSPAEIAAHFMSRFRDKSEEVLLLLGFNGRQRLISESQLSVGTIDAVQARPRDIFEQAITSKVKGFVLLHNHPSGNPTPSKADKHITSLIQAGGELLGIPLLDHVVLGNNTYFSFHEAGLI